MTHFYEKSNNWQFWWPLCVIDHCSDDAIFGIERNSERHKHKLWERGLRSERGLSGQGNFGHLRLTGRLKVLGEGHICCKNKMTKTWPSVTRMNWRTGALKCKWNSSKLSNIWLLFAIAPSEKKIFYLKLYH